MCVWIISYNVYGLFEGGVWTSINVYVLDGSDVIINGMVAKYYHYIPQENLQMFIHSNMVEMSWL